MEKREHHVVRLLKNRLYPTYQLYAAMANKKTDPREGLRIGALTVIEWLRQRLQGDIPVELEQPGPAYYRDVCDDNLKSFHMSSGFVIDIVSLPEQGAWTLQITEPDLGSDPGNPEQDRQPVPGRIIETNIGFHINGKTLECGFQTVISDPEVTGEEADVYRLVVVRRLMKNPDFGLRQLTTLKLEAEQISTVDQIKKLIAAQKEDGNYLPTVIFTHARRETAAPNTPPDPMSMLQSKSVLSGFPPKLTMDVTVKGKTLPLLGEPAKKQGKEARVPDKLPLVELEAYLPYEANAFAKEAAAFCRTYVLKNELLARFNAQSGLALLPGDIVMIEPSNLGGRNTIYSFKHSKIRQDEIIDSLIETVLNYPRGKMICFGSVAFISSARQDLLQASREALQQSEVVSEQYALDFAVQQERWNLALAEKETECHNLKEQLIRLREYQERLEQEKAELRDIHKDEQGDLQLRIDERDRTILFLRRKVSQPRVHSQIAEWIERNFEGRILMFPKAVNLLEEKSAQGVDPGLICDALDFLATDYWDNRYLRISEDEMNRRCSEKYGRRFEIKPTGENTINFTPGQYKIKYYMNPRTGKPMESGLDYHLRVGGDPENLLRIYFLHDDEKKLIVVGSLPRHLRTMTIK